MNRDKIHRHLRYYGWYMRLLSRMRRVYINQRRTTLYHALEQLLTDFGTYDLFNKANGVAFSFTLAIFPATIFTFTLIPYIHEIFPRITEGTIIDFFSNVMPDDMFAAAKETIHDIVGVKRDGLLSFGAIFALLLATNGMNGLMSAFNSIYKTNDRRGYFRTRLVGLGLTLMLSFVLFLAIFLMVIGKSFIEILNTKHWLSGDFAYYLMFVIKYGIIISSFFVAISLIYYFAPAIHDRWTFFSSGAIFSSFGSVAASFAFSFYINNFASYNKLYGSIGMLIALMLWLLLLALILLVGFLYNVSVDKSIEAVRIENTESLFG